MGDARARILIVDDHLMFGESLARLLGLESDFEVVGVAVTANDARQLVESSRPAVVVIDYQLPDMDGVALTRILKDAHPDLHVIILTGLDDDAVLRGAIEAGAAGFLTKDRAADEVVEAVRTVLGGEALISPQMLARLLSQLSGRSTQRQDDQLTAREHEILVLMAKGLSNKAIATEIFLSVNTVRNHVQSILSKLGAHSKLEAISTAVRRDIIEYPGQ
ncbi:MAG: response regulator [Acidimicrobiales bacterium]